jgi:hypothetical protein
LSIKGSNPLNGGSGFSKTLYFLPTVSSLTRPNGWQRPNLALVLYIKDTNGFHEPTEEAIAFCQKLAEPDLEIHIAWITNLDNRQKWQLEITNLLAEMV